MPRSRFRSTMSLIGGLVLLAGCGGEPAAKAAETGAAAGPAELTAFQLEHGIGPVTEPVVLGPVDPAKVAAGQAIFETKCSACHKMEERYVGPALGTVTTDRSPAFVLNMMLNPQEMYTRHPAVKQLLAEYMNQMPDVGLTQDEARAILNYLRSQDPQGAGS